MVEGKLQIEGEVVHVIVRRCFNLNRLLQKSISNKGETIQVTPSRADERSGTNDTRVENVQGKIFPGGRNFR
jgi:error-prone DNA polymerase